MHTRRPARRRDLILLVLILVAILGVSLAALWPVIGSLAGTAAEGGTGRLAAVAGLVVVLVALGFGGASRGQ